MGPGVVVDQKKVDELKSVARVSHGLFIAVGALFVFLGLLVKKFPVPVTILGLVLYIGSFVIDFAIGYTYVGEEAFKSIGSGIWLKIVIIIGLVKSIQAAIAYEKERRAERDLEVEASF